MHVAHTGPSQYMVCVDQSTHRPSMTMLLFLTCNPMSSFVCAGLQSVQLPRRDLGHLAGGRFSYPGALLVQSNVVQNQQGKCGACRLQTTTATLPSAALPAYGLLRLGYARLMHVLCLVWMQLPPLVSSSKPLGASGLAQCAACMTAAAHKVQFSASYTASSARICPGLRRWSCCCFFLTFD